MRSTSFLPIVACPPNVQGNDSKSEIPQQSDQLATWELQLLHQPNSYTWDTISGLACSQLYTSFFDTTRYCYSVAKDPIIEKDGKVQIHILDSKQSKILIRCNQPNSSRSISTPHLKTY